MADQSGAPEAITFDWPRDVEPLVGFHGVGLGQPKELAGGEV